MKPGLTELYARIPRFECIPGCTDCCGPAPWSQPELDRVQGAVLLKGLEVIERGTLMSLLNDELEQMDSDIRVASGSQAHLTPKEGSFVLAELSLDGSLCVDCPFSKHGHCDVYDDRPLMCRLYGAIEDEPLLTCPHGCGPERKLTKAEGTAMMMEYKEFCEETAS